MKDFVLLLFFLGSILSLASRNVRECPNPLCSEDVRGVIGRNEDTIIVLSRRAKCVRTRIIDRFTMIYRHHTSVVMLLTGVLRTCKMRMCLLDLVLTSSLLALFLNAQYVRNNARMSK